MRFQLFKQFDYAVIRFRMVGAMIKIMLLENVQHRKRCLCVCVFGHAFFYKAFYSVARSVGNLAYRQRGEIEHAQSVIYTYGKVFLRVQNRTVQIEDIKFVFHCQRIIPRCCGLIFGKALLSSYIDSFLLCFRSRIFSCAELLPGYP